MAASFIDKARIFCRAGKGGNGAVAFHREKYVSAGGPDGGDGGNGGNIVLVVDDNMSTLMDFRYKRKYVADNGMDGQGARKFGKQGKDLTIRVPRGTVVRDAESNEIIKDMSDSEPFILCRGGKGGWGNAHFATPTRQAPRFAKSGLEGEEHDVVLELKLLADTGTGVCHCPISNMKLASGIARIPEMLALGVPVGLGVDGSASNDGSSLMEELRVAFLLHRLNASRKAPSGYDILKMATKGSARLLGRKDIGELSTGKCCDLFLIDSRRLELTGACYDPKSVLATVGVRGPVDYTVVNGRIVVKDGCLVTIDEERTAREAQAACDSYLSR